MATRNNRPLPASPSAPSVPSHQQFPPQQHVQYQQNLPQAQPQQNPQQNPQQQPQQHAYAHRNSVQAQQQQPADKGRPRSRAFSFRSDKSQKSAGSQPNKGGIVDGNETHAEKESRRLHSKADPTMAMNEAEPCLSPHRTAARQSSRRHMLTFGE